MVKQRYEEAGKEKPYWAGAIFLSNFELSCLEREIRAGPRREFARLPASYFVCESSSFH